MFGPRRERYVPGSDQQLLFEVLPLETKQLHDAPAAVPEPPPTKLRRKPRRKFVFPEFLSVRHEDHSLQPEELPCRRSGARRVVIRTHITKQLGLEQAQAYVGDVNRVDSEVGIRRLQLPLHRRRKPGTASRIEFNLARVTIDNQFQRLPSAKGPMQGSHCCREILWTADVVGGRREPVQHAARIARNTWVDDGRDSHTRARQRENEQDTVTGLCQLSHTTP